MTLQLPSLLKFYQASETLQLKYDITTPTFVFIGPSQAGKSSIIEFLLQKFVLPHGHFMSNTTLIINLKCNGQGPSWRFPITECDSQVFYCDDEIRNELLRRYINTQAKHSFNPINLEYNNDDLANMTMIELPEIQGDDGLLEWENIHSKYLEDPNTLIIAVLPALKELMSRQTVNNLFQVIEKNQNRTIIVFTYLDSIIAESDLKNFDMYNFENYLLVTGTLCASKSARGKKKMEEIYKIERKYFRPKNFKRVDPHGIAALHKILRQFVSHHLQGIILHFLNIINGSINNLKEGLTCDQEERMNSDKIVLEQITRYSNTFVSLLAGSNPDIETKHLVGGARVGYIFREIFSNSLDLIDSLSGLTRPSISATIRNICGTRPEVLFIPEACFEVLARKQVTQLKRPCYQCVELVYDEIQKLKADCSFCLNSDQFPRLCDLLLKTTTNLIDRAYCRCYELVQELINMELAYINTLDTNFLQNLEASKVSWFLTQTPSATRCRPADNLKEDEEVSDPRLLAFGGPNWLTNLLSPKVPETVNGDNESIRTLSGSETCSPNLLSISSKEEADCQLLENLIHAYFSTVRRYLKDSIPKAIMLRMVNYVRDNLYQTLLESLREDKQSLERLLYGAIPERKEQIAHLQMLCEYNQILQQVQTEINLTN